MVIPDRSQNTLMVPNMATAPPQMDAASILLGETHGDVLTSTLVISKTPNRPTQDRLDSPRKLLSPGDQVM